jgi:hypothetical protein
VIKDERQSYLEKLDDELLKGGVILSEWCSFIVREFDEAFVAGAYLGAILVGLAGVETYLRSEYATKKGMRLLDLISDSPIEEELRRDIDDLRKYRNKWVHVEDPWKDARLVEISEEVDKEIEHMALHAARVLRKTIYENQWV